MPFWLPSVPARSSQPPSSSDRFGGLRIIADIETLAADPQIDAIYLATPNTAHYGQAKTLLSAGKTAAY